jgi:hypothetical protein
MQAQHEGRFVGVEPALHHQLRTVCAAAGELGRQVVVARRDARGLCGSKGSRST